MSTEDPEETPPPRSNAPTVMRDVAPRPEPAPTVVLPTSTEGPDLRLVATTGCALQVVVVGIAVLTVAWTLLAVVFAGQLSAEQPILGRAVVLAQGMVALGALVAGAQLVRYLRAVADARRGRQVAVRRALAAHRDFVATVVTSITLTALTLVLAAGWWLGAG